MDIDIIGVNQAGEESGNTGMTQGHTLAWLQDVDADNNNISDTWYETWQVVYRDVRILDANNDEVGVLNLTQHNLNQTAEFDLMQSMLVDAAAPGPDPAFPYKHPVERLDVSNDGFITPLDALMVINRINDVGVGQLDAMGTTPEIFYDSHVDNFLTALDALEVINHLNLFAAESEGEPDVAAAQQPAGQLALAAISGTANPNQPARSQDAATVDAEAPGQVLAETVVRRRSAVVPAVEFHSVTPANDEVDATVGQTTDALFAEETDWL